MLTTAADVKDAKTTLRVSSADLRRIDERARSHGLSRTQFLIELGLGRDPSLPALSAEGLAERVEALERWTAAADGNFRLLGMPVEVDGEEVGA